MTAILYMYLLLQQQNWKYDLNNYNTNLFAVGPNPSYCK